MLKKSIASAKKPSKPSKTTPEEKEMVAKASLPPRGVKVKSKWTIDQVAKMITDIQTARMVITLWQASVNKKKSKSWSETHYSSLSGGASASLSQLLANLFEVRKEMSSW